MSSPPRRVLRQMRRRVAQQQHQQQRAYDGKAEYHEGVDIGEHVCLILHGARQERRGAGGSFRVANGATGNSFRILLQALVGEERDGLT